MLRMLTQFNEITRLVKLANRLSRENPNPNTPVFGYLLTNRSFLVPLIGVIINVLIIFNFPFMAPFVEMLKLAGPDILADNIVVFITAITVVWGIIERALTSARVVFTRKGAERAVVKVVGDDDLAKALIKATS